MNNGYFRNIKLNYQRNNNNIYNNNNNISNNSLRNLQNYQASGTTYPLNYPNVVSNVTYPNLYTSNPLYVTTFKFNNQTGIAKIYADIKMSLVFDYTIKSINLSPISCINKFESYNSGSKISLYLNKIQGVRLNNLNDLLEYSKPVAFTVLDSNNKEIGILYLNSLL